MQKSLEAITKEAEEVIVFLQRQLGVELPDSLDAAIKQDWMTVGLSAGEEYMEHLPKSVGATWKQRVISIESANRILVLMEDRLVEKFVQTESEIACKALLTTYFQIQWWMEHAGSVTTVLVEAVYLFRGQLLDAYISAEGLILEALYGSWLNLWDRVKDSASKWVIALSGVVAFAFGAIAAMTIQPVLAAFGAAGFGAAVRPVSNAWRDAFADCQKKAFPQGRGRWRRRNPSRRN